MKEKQKLIVLVGPTAVGKTKLSIEIAKTFNAEIISGDSMQIYRGMDIGTAKIQPCEMDGVPHHLLDIRDPDEPFSVAEFQSLVRQKISEISNRGALPFIVGGTGLYIQSVLYDYQFSESPGDPLYRQQLEKIASGGGTADLYEKLKTIDPESAENIHPHNIRRLIRALEIFHSTGKTMSEYQQEQNKGLMYDTALAGLAMERELLYTRINKRVDLMLQEGLLEEVMSLHQRGIRDVQSVKAIGYKEIYQYLDGLVTLEEAIEHLKKNSRNYAKRQLTWFRNKMDVRWFDMTAEGEHLKKTAEIIQFIAGMLHLKSNT
ncbi:MAG TPA: tRNA (adenosine(37)-N6)-dimethylallyltransferase MiaA [Bacillaceae bacterium]